MATQPLPSWGSPKQIKSGHMTPAILGVPKMGRKLQGLHHPEVSGSPNGETMKWLHNRYPLRPP